MQSAKATAVAVWLVTYTLAQGPPHNGPRPVDPSWFALTGARVVTAPGVAPATATIVVRDGRIAAVGADEPPRGATRIDCSGTTIYPGLIESFYASDVPALDPVASDRHWNPLIQPQRTALDGGLVAEADRRALRASGFTIVATAPAGGILKGQSDVVLLDEPQETAPVRIVRRAAYTVASLQTSAGGYPNSEMGAIALLRQTLLDGQWYDRCQRAIATEPGLAAGAPQPSAVLAAVASQQQLPLWLDAANELQALRLLRIAAEFERRAVVVGNGMEFRRLEALAASGTPIIVPLHLPDPPDVTTEAAAEAVDLRQLQSWELAPGNSKRLLDAGVEIAWTTARLPDRADFPARVRDAITHGVAFDQALAALTTVPARLLGIDDRAGTIAAGKLANLVVVAGDLFQERSSIREVWVGGTRHVLAGPEAQALDGAFDQLAGWPGEAAPRLTIDGAKVTAKAGDAEVKVADVVQQGGVLTCRLDGAALPGGPWWLRLHATATGLAGTAAALDGKSFELRAARLPATDPPARPEAGPDTRPVAGAPTPPPAPAATRPVPTPLGGYGGPALPPPQEFAIVGATVWTCDGRGVLRDGAVYARGGKIVFAGPRQDLPQLPADARVIDGRGKHVTPGLIDCHSHTGISRGVNESGQAVTAEVRIQDVIDPDDVNWYRQLAGGVTAVNQLHGSANVIGGQSCTVKIRFGVASPDDMRLAGAPSGIKFALGENPRRANSGGGNSRYPNSRMGVEALLRDRFAAAEAYAREHAAYTALAPPARARSLPPRRDLELEALAEVLAGERRIHCHSYRQDEIFMLCGLAQEYGFRIGTFQHVLEGYKVADAIRQAAIGASSFTDWWAYKFEVYDAIPDNGAILHENGVNVSFNSDSNEHARRLNTEAGKAVKYGRVAAHEALWFVTRNPAIQLGIFERTGSLTAGKDADVVLWSDDPLSYAARCEATWVDGRPLFTRERDAELRQQIAAERHRLIALALAKGKGRRAREGDPKDAYWAAEQRAEHYCCREHEGGR